MKRELEKLTVEFEFPNEETEFVTDDLPELIPLSDSDSEDEDDEPSHDDLINSQPIGIDEDDEPSHGDLINGQPIETVFRQVHDVLTRCQPYPGDGVPIDPTFVQGYVRYIITCQDCDTIIIYDRVQGFDTFVPPCLLSMSSFPFGKWYAERCV